MKFFQSKQKRLEMIQALRPTSKATLKMQCLIICKADIDEANKLYDFFAKDMPDLPDFDPAPKTWVDNTKNVATSAMSWLKENQGTLAQIYDFVRTIVVNREMPTINTGEGIASSPLPPINE